MEELCETGIRTLDDVTGLPMRADAEAALAEPVKARGQTFAAVLVLECLDNVNRRFGKEVGNEILAEFTG
jgi:GGDEF domain-containing protein